MIRPGRALPLIALTLLLAACMGRDGVVPKATLASINPASGLAESGTRVTLSGSNFHRLPGSGDGQADTLSVEVCGVPLEQLELVVKAERTVVLPPASAIRVQLGDELTGVLGQGATGGVSDVTVNLSGGQRLVLPAAFNCVVPGVTAAISTDVTSGPAPLTITFDASSSTSVTGTISEYLWDFGDGDTATGEIVSHTFGEVGTHQVTMVAADDTGASDEASVLIEVINSLPVASIAADPVSGTANAPVTVTFDAGASSDSDGDTLAFSWTIDGEPAGSESTASHTFSRSGNYEVSLEVSDSRGATVNRVMEYAVGNSAPTAVFSTTPDPATGNGPLIVTFDASASSDPDGSIASYEWDLGDGSTATGAIVTRSYTSGTYDVVLTVKDDEGQAAQFTGQVLVDNSPPVAQFTTSPDPASGPAPLTVQFDATGSGDPDGSIVSYDWEFGTSGTGTGVSPTHVFPRSGDYLVTLTVEDDEGATGTFDLLVQVSNSEPVAVAVVTSQSGYSASFSAAGSYDLDGTITSYEWTLGDGTTLTGPDISHTYPWSGSYDVELTVTDDESATSKQELKVEVVNTPPVSVPEASVAGYAVTFDGGNSHDPDGGPITSYLWDLGDGTTSTAISFVHLYENSEARTVKLTVTDSESAEHEATIEVNPENFPPTAYVRMDPSSPSDYAPLTVTFSAAGSSEQLGGTIIEYRWDFPTGSPVYGVDSSYTFNTPGDNPVKLTVTDNEGVSSDTSVTVHVLTPSVQSVVIDQGDQSLLVGDTTDLTTMVTGDGPFNPAVTWTSSDLSVANVSIAGVVTAIGEGTAVITATSIQDPSKSDHVVVSARRALGTALDEYIQDMAVDDEDNIYLTGHVFDEDGPGTDILLLKLDPEGKLLWRETYGTLANDSASSIALDPFDGSIILAGHTGGIIATGAHGDSDDLILMKIDQLDRNVVWTYQYGDSGNDGASDVVVDSFGNIYFTGSYNRDVPNSCSADCGRIIVGRANSSGTSVAVALHGHNTTGTGEAIALDGSGNIVVAGNSLGVFGDAIQGGQGAYFMVIDPADLGSRITTMPVDTNRVDYAGDIHVTQDGSIVWVGSDNVRVAESANPVIRVFNADYSLRDEEWLVNLGAPRGSYLDHAGHLVIGARPSFNAMELLRLDLSDLSTIGREQITSATPGTHLLQFLIRGIGEQTDGTIVLAGSTTLEDFERNQGRYDPFVWIKSGW